jgi:hypothetical protein
LDGEEQRLVDAINAYRLQQGRGPLGASITLTQASDWMARDMAARNDLGKFDSIGRSPAQRARAFGFPGAMASVQENALAASGGVSAAQVFERWKAAMADHSALLDPAWKNLGIGRVWSSQFNRWYWSLTLGATWDKTIPLAGEDEEGRIDRNDLIRTRPPASSLAIGRRFSGYGDDGAPYDPFHCDLDSSPQACWRDAPPQGNPRLSEASNVANLAGLWQVKYTISSMGVVHADYGGFDRTGYGLTLQIQANGSWTMRGYRAFQVPVPLESGVWQAVHDDARNEEVVTFTRQNGLPRAVIRVHAAPGQLTFFAVDGGGAMKNFFRGVSADDDRADDPQILFVRP